MLLIRLEENNFNVVFMLMLIVVFFSGVLLIRSKFLLAAYGVLTITHFLALLTRWNMPAEMKSLFLIGTFASCCIMYAAAYINIYFVGLQKKAIADADNELRLRANMLKAGVSEVTKRSNEIKEVTEICAHDLKQPLYSAYSMADMLLDDTSVPKPIFDHIKHIKNKLSTLNKLIDNLIRYVNLSENDVAKKQVDFNALIAPVLVGVPNAETASFSALTLMPTLYCNEIQLFQVFEVLFSNAIEHNAKASNLKVSYGYQKEGNRHLFFVMDNGKGIDSRYFNKIFKPFEHLKEGENQEASGVGLALAHKIITNLNGKIWVESELGKGACFFFSLPVIGVNPNLNTEEIQKKELKNSFTATRFTSSLSQIKTSAM